MKITSKNLSFPKTFPKNIVSVVLTSNKNIEFFKYVNGHMEMKFGIGKKNEITLRRLITFVRQIVDCAKKNKAKKLAFNFSDFNFPKLENISSLEIASLVAQNLEMANFEFTKFKQKPKEGWNVIEEVVFYGVNTDAQKGFKKGKVIGEEINKSRILANTPGGDMTPKVLASEARKAVRGTKVKARVLGEKEMTRLKMGAILGVAQGSEEEPQFIILEYKGLPRAKSTGNLKNKPIVLIGKGVTFDTGGLNLKPSTGILDMHMDMSGGAAVIHTLVLASKLGIKKNIIGLIPAVENMLSGSSYRPGDILKSMSGKTIEILNTDAEGRVILADALTYAKKYKPRLVVDVATLTGAAAVALGQRASVILTKDEKLQKLFMQLGEESGEYVWPLPLWDEYDEDVKGNFADVANVPVVSSGYGGAINGGAFLKQFADGYPWVHIDMAPRMLAVQGDFLAKGSAGAPIRLLIKLLEKY